VPARLCARSAPHTSCVSLLQLHLTTWPDPLLEESGYQFDSLFIELFWLPVLGPSATVLFRRLGLLLAGSPGGMTVEMNELGRELGLGSSESRHAPLPRAISRLVRFGLAKRSGSGQLAVRRTVGPLSQHHLSVLPAAIRESYQRVISLARACDPDLPATSPSPTTGPTGG
jgi:hypothetical protein